MGASGTRFPKALRQIAGAAGTLGLALAQAGEPPIFASGFEDAECAPLYSQGFLMEWSQAYPQGWPGYNQVARFFPQLDSYITLRFTAGPAGQLGELLGVPVTPSVRQGLVSISRTQGCFDPVYTGERCISALETTQSVTWTTGSSPFRCELVPGEVYYVNITLGGLQPPGPYCDRNVDLCMIELSQNLN